jgi:hypothetical protein
MKPLLVGESTSKGHEDVLSPIPKGGSGYRLIAILGMTEAEYVETFDRVNLCADGWNGAEAKGKAATLLWRHRIIMLGRKVTTAFGFRYEPFTEVADGILCLPHPSGRCRTWNDPSSVLAARETVNKLLSKSQKIVYRGYLMDTSSGIERIPSPWYPPGHPLYVVPASPEYRCTICGAYHAHPDPCPIRYVTGESDLND